MGDDMFDFVYDDWDNVMELSFVSRVDRVANAAEARRTLEAAIRKLPDSALQGLKSFRIMVSAKSPTRKG
jgi:hypothetical protein